MMKVLSLKRINRDSCMILMARKTKISSQASTKRRRIFEDSYLSASFLNHRARNGLLRPLAFFLARSLSLLLLALELHFQSAIGEDDWGSPSERFRPCLCPISISPLMQGTTRTSVKSAANVSFIPSLISSRSSSLCTRSSSLCILNPLYSHRQYDLIRIWISFTLFTRAFSLRLVSFFLFFCKDGWKHKLYLKFIVVFS